MAEIYDTPSTVVAEAGNVLVDGPDGVSVALTPEAAAEISDRLLHAASMAKGQQVAQRTALEENEARHRSM